MTPLRQVANLSTPEARLITIQPWEPQLIKEIEKVDEVIECHHITGADDFILKIISKDIPSYQKLMLEKVSNIKVVDNMQSMVVLSTFKDSKVMPIPDSIDDH